MLGNGALGQLALGQFPILTPSLPDPLLPATSTLIATANMAHGLAPAIRGAGALITTGTVVSSLNTKVLTGLISNTGNALVDDYGEWLVVYEDRPPVLVGNSSMRVISFVIQPYDTPIINGWYVDSKGGINYYYRTSDGRNLPRPPIKI